MRKKPDILLLLAVLVVSGVLISNLLVFKQENKTNRLPVANTPSYTSDDAKGETITSHEVVRIYSSKRQTR